MVDKRPAPHSASRNAGTRPTRYSVIPVLSVMTSATTRFQVEVLLRATHHVQWNQPRALTLDVSLTPWALRRCGCYWDVFMRACSSLPGMRINRTRAPRGARGASFVSGSVCWVAVSSTDRAGSQNFYSSLFGWTYQIDSPGGCRQEMTAWCGGRPVAGLATVPVRVGQATWTLYLATTNVLHSAQLLR